MPYMALKAMTCMYIYGTQAYDLHPVCGTQVYDLHPVCGTQAYNLHPVCGGQDQALQIPIHLQIMGTRF